MLCFMTLNVVNVLFCVINPLLTVSVIYRAMSFKTEVQRFLSPDKHVIALPALHCQRNAVWPRTLRCLNLYLNHKR